MPTPERRPLPNIAAEGPDRVCHNLDCPDHPARIFQHGLCRECLRHLVRGGTRRPGAVRGVRAYYAQIIVVPARDARWACKVSGCQEPAVACGLCRHHLDRARAGQDKRLLHYLKETET